MAQRQYRNPPIEEAVCEFRFAPGLAWNLTIPGLFYEKIKDFYTGEPEPQHFVDAELQASSYPQNSEIMVRQALTKLLFPSANDTRLVGVGLDVLSIHILRPYEGWDEFKGRISQAFDVYEDFRLLHMLNSKNAAFCHRRCRFVVSREIPASTSRCGLIFTRV